MNGEKCKLEGDDWILIDSKGEEGEFIFVSPERWSPDIRDCVLLLPSIDFYKTLIGSMSVENALKQLEIDFVKGLAVILTPDEISMFVDMDFSAKEEKRKKRKKRKNKKNDE